jgi:hypothetical protein
MSPEQFTYWLQGFTELNGAEQPTAEQWKSITEHLQTVFVKVTPPVSPPFSLRDANPIIGRSSEYRLADHLRKLGINGDWPYMSGSPLITC